jgi:hypothetical protein
LGELKEWRPKVNGVCFFTHKIKKSHLALPAVPFTKGELGKQRINKDWV